MRAFILVTCLVASVLARPEAGFSYNGLQRGLPQNAHQLEPHVHQQLPAEHSFASFGTPQNTYLAPVPSSAGNADQAQSLDAHAAPAQDIQKSNQHHEDSYNMAYQHSANSHESSGYAYTPQTTIHKHIYVHVPPKDFEEEDAYTPRVRHQAAPKQKHYKIVFIKAPAPPSARPPVVPPPPQNEEKTLIYVLHKKPEPEQEIVIPTAEPTQPSKPEVYFIKYKTKKEEAPVYGPPQQQQQQQPIYFDMQPRNIEAPSVEYGAPDANEFLPEEHVDVASPLSTVQPVEVPEPQQQQQQQEQQQPQQQRVAAELPSDVYGAPTMTAESTPEEPQPTVAAPSNQYLAPEPSQQTMAPIVVEDAHMPASNYGPPNRFFLKKKK